MAVRSNVGNVVTNAIQTASVGSAYASRVFRDRADSSLNNMTEEQKQKYAQYQTDRKLKEIEDFYAKPEKEAEKQRLAEEQAKTTPKTYEKYSKEEAELIGEADKKRRLERARNFLDKEESTSIEEIFENVNEIIPTETKEGQEVNLSMSRNIFFNDLRKSYREIDTEKETFEDFMKEK